MDKAPLPLLENGKLDLTQVKHGIALLTFDDSCYETWLPQMDLFEKYNARGTFFYHNEITETVADSMKQLMARGHSVGFHTIGHRNAVDITPEAYFEEFVRPQIEQAARFGVENVPFFAYPNNMHNDAFDGFLSRYFTRFRAGAGISAPKGFRIADFDAAYLPLEEISRQQVMGGCGIGPYYDSTQENLDSALKRAAAENKLITFFSHAILPEGRNVHMSVDMLEKMLQKAVALGMVLPGFKELP